MALMARALPANRGCKIVGAGAMREVTNAMKETSDANL
jgi:hypothetical protein